MIGTVLNERYRIDAELGRGGMGVIYRAHDVLLGRDVVVKVLSDATLSAESCARLLREAKATAQLNHPNIVSVYDAGEATLPARTVPFIVMELVKGESLRVGRSGDLAYGLDQILSIGQQVCAALEHAHARGIIHRDVKPENVLLTPDGTAKLADFGLAHTVASRLTTDGMIVGTLFYTAPEQALGQEIDERVDLYAFGVMLYELTAGRLPFAGDSVAAIISQHLHAPVVPPSAHNAEIPPALDVLIVQLLSKRAEDRPASAEKVQQRLAAISKGTRDTDLITEQLSIPRACSCSLPAQTTLFVGREAQLAAVHQKLTASEGADGARLLTLTGPGGTGKTRLSLQAATNLQDSFRDGVFFVALAPISDPALVMPAIAQALGIREVEGCSLLETVKDYLRDKRALLVLDNFEQVLDAVPLVSDLLAAAPRLKVLATSRASLRLRGEHVYPVPPLALPDSKELPPLESLAQIEAVQLFVQRAQAAKAGFDLSGENGPAVAAICERLDGLPLAIELAAARVRFLPPQKMLSQLNNRLRLLTGGARDLPARHQTLRNAIDWGYDLLDADDKTLFRRLAVFCCSFTLEAADAVCNASAGLDVLNGIESLVDQSMLSPFDVDASGEPRFGMLETVREYALERLMDSGEAEMIRRQHANFFVALAEETEPQLDGAEQVACLERLEAEHDNARLALWWALSCNGPDAELGVRLAGALGRFWRIRGYWTEGRRWVERALEKSERASVGVSANMRAKALWTAARWRETAERARPLLQESLALYRQLEDKRGIARALCRLGLVAEDFGQAAELYEQSLALFRELDDKPGILDALFRLGVIIWRRQGDRERGAALIEQSLALAQEMGDKWSATRRLRQLGNIAVEQAEYGRADALFGESLALARELGDKEGIAGLLNSLGEMARLQGDYERAAVFYDESLSLRRELGNKFRIAMMLHNRGHVSLRQDDGRQASVFFEESLALFRQLKMSEGSAECVAGLAGVARVEGQAERAARLFGTAEALLEITGAGLAATDQAEWDRNLAVARAQLDEETFAAAWAEGRALAADDWEGALDLIVHNPLAAERRS